jgi:hypothetical protein
VEQSLEEIGYKGNKVIETAKDVQRFRDPLKEVNWTSRVRSFITGI